MWLSVPPWAPTGYGTQTAQAVDRIAAAGHNVAISAQVGLQWTKTEWHGMTVYPGDHTRLNKRMLRHQIADFADRLGVGSDEVQVISLFDIWPWVDPSPAYGGMVADFDGLNLAAWLPVDSLPVNPKTQATLHRFNVRPIAMSRFGETQLRDAGFDPLYVPHAIDTAVYAPQEDREACRRALNFPKDRFVVGMVAHNEGLQPARKAFPNVLQAFAEFQKRHDDALLYLHTEPTGRAWNGLDLLGMAQYLGIPANKISFVPQIPYMSGSIAPELMAGVYSAMDVLVNPSYAEGFGLAIIEAQACGTPVIVSHWTSMPELVAPESGWTVGGQPWFNEAAGAMWLHPSTEEILAALEQAYEDRGDQGRRDRAREFALQYDSQTVFDEFWVPALEALDRPREIPPLVPLNREQRRAQQRNLKAAA